MPPKKKIKLVKGQQRLQISTSNLEILGNSDHSDEHESHDMKYPESSSSLSTSAKTNSLTGSLSESSSCKALHHNFLEIVLARVSGIKFICGFCCGVYCQYCCDCHREVWSRSGVFASNGIVFHMDKDGDSDWIYILFCVSTTSQDQYLKKKRML